MIITDPSRATEDLMGGLESLVALLDHLHISAARPGYNAKTYDQKKVTVENDRILGLPVFSYEISLSERFDPKKHFKQFQQFAQGLWRDYALLMLTDQTIAVLDLDLKKIVSTITVDYPVHEFHVESISASLEGIAKLLERGKEILENWHNGDSEAPSDLGGIVQLFEMAHMGIMHRTGRKGFFSVASEETDSSFRPETLLRKLDLSQISEEVLKEIPNDEPVYLSADLSLDLAVSMDLTTADEFTVLAKVRRSF
jgi:hypothetical protein